MPSRLLKRSIKSSLEKAGLAISRTDHGVVIYRTGTGHRSILHSALFNSDAFSSGEYSADKNTNVEVNQDGLYLTSTGGQDSFADGIAVSLSGVTIAALPVEASHASKWLWPEALKNGLRTLEIRHKDTAKKEVFDTYLIDFRQDNQRLFGTIYSELITEPIMGIYMIGFREGHCYAQGWIYDPNHEPAEKYFTLNGEIPTVRFTRSQPEWETHIGPVSSYFTMKSDRHFSFFDAELENTCAKDQAIVISYQSLSSADLNRCQGAYLEDDQPIPGGDIFKRVSGDENPFTFRYVGYSTFLKLEAICNKYLAENFGKITRVLDWGCGCGRVTRYFSKYKSSTEIHGIDIDSTGINWLRENLDFGNFSHIQPDTKTPFPDGHFDFIFGISIFTHLTEDDHFFWLKELQRIVAKNGIVAVTTGSTVMRARMFNVNIGDHVSDRLAGYTDQGQNAQINGSTDDDEYYRNTYITKEYIETVWSEYFDILDVHSGLISCLQDMVIMRRKA